MTNHEIKMLLQTSHAMAKKYNLKQQDIRQIIKESRAEKATRKLKKNY